MNISETYINYKIFSTSLFDAFRPKIKKEYTFNYDDQNFVVEIDRFSSFLDNHSNLQLLFEDEHDFLRDDIRIYVSNGLFYSVIYFSDWHKLLASSVIHSSARVREESIKELDQYITLYGTPFNEEGEIAGEPQKKKSDYTILRVSNAYSFRQYNCMPFSDQELADKFKEDYPDADVSKGLPPAYSQKFIKKYAVLVKSDELTSEVSGLKGVNAFLFFNGEFELYPMSTYLSDNYIKALKKAPTFYDKNGDFQHDLFSNSLKTRSLFVIPQVKQGLLNVFKDVFEKPDPDAEVEDGVTPYPALMFIDPKAKNYYTPLEYDINNI